MDQSTLGIMEIVGPAVLLIALLVLVLRRGSSGKGRAWGPADIKLTYDPPVSDPSEIAVVREAIEYLPVLQQPAVLMLNPADMPLVREAIGEELDKGGWRVVQDAAIARGGCKVDTATNQIDAQVATRWERLTHALGKNVEWLGP